MVAPATFAQSVDGKWSTSLHGRAPDRKPITLTLASDGSKLTGTVYANEPIALDGTIDGNTLKVTLRVTTASGAELPMHYVAVLQGDEITFTYQSENGRPPVFGPAAREFTATRVK